MNCVKVALAFALVGVVVPFQSSAAVHPVLLHLQAALDVDREGRVAAVTYVDGKEVPDAIRQRGEQVAMGWKFEPPVRGGKSVAGRTYANMSVCIAPQGDGMQYSILFAGNGPGLSDEVRGSPRATSIPLPRLMRQGVDDLSGKVIFVVSTDGKAQVESATIDDPELQKLYGRMWRSDQRWYFKNLRFLPELIDGVPTATRLETTVAFDLSPIEGPKAYAAKTRDRDAESDACQALKSTGNRQIASDSAFKRIEG